MSPEDKLLKEIKDMVTDAENTINNASSNLRVMADWAILTQIGQALIQLREFSDIIDRTKKMSLRESLNYQIDLWKRALINDWFSQSNTSAFANAQDKLQRELFARWIRSYSLI